MLLLEALIGVEFSLPVHAGLHELDVPRRITLIQRNPSWAEE
jgi:hypothetical protein